MSGDNWHLEDDRKGVRVTIPTEPVPCTGLFETARVEFLLRKLGEFRALMIPEVPRTFAMGQKVEAVADPAWVTEPDAMLGHSLLHIREPRFGWLHFVLPPHEAKKLAEYLLRQAERAGE